MVNKYKWDGEKIVETTEAQKHSPKDIINGLAHVRNQITQMGQQKDQLMQQTEQLLVRIESATKFEIQLKEFEEGCINIQVDKLKLFITQITDDCEKKALEDAKTEIAEAPDSYTEEQKNNLHYVKYQKLLATNEKIAEKISSQIITKYLYEEPIFNNPFK